MRPICVSVDVPHVRERVYAFLDVMANHERFMDHMLRDWACSGPATGVGAGRGGPASLSSSAR
jgi:hypothetical protein